jgi:outer membrane immunogenic protein
MNRFIRLATMAVAVLSAGATAGAADLPLAVKTVNACGIGLFQGWYAGVHVGSATHTANRTDQDAFLNIVVPASATYVPTNTSVFGGAQVGYNYQCQNAVLGFEVDGSWVGSSRTLRILPNFDPTLISTLENRLDQVVTARGRAGIVASDRLMVYVTGGVAGARIKTTYSVTDALVPFTDVATFNEWVWGWTAGFGAEWAWSERFSVRAEALYMGFGPRDLVFTTPNFGQAANVTHSDSVWLARIGVNVRLGG